MSSRRGGCRYTCASPAMAKSALDVELLPWQEEVIADDHRFKVVAGGRRVGKSVLSRMWILNRAVKDAGLYYIVSPTYRQSKAIHWRDMNKEIPQDWVVSSNATELSFELKNGSRIELKGSENPDSLRGVKLKALVIDEIASVRNWNWLWQEVLRPTLTDYESPAMFISTPKGYNHFYDLWKRGQKEGSDYHSWQFTTYENPKIPEGEIKKAKEELTGEAFSQEYLAEFKQRAGLVFPYFERTTHLIEPFDVPKHWPRHRGFDFGSNHPTASVRVAVHDDVWFVERCYKENRQTIKDHAEAIRAQDYGLGFTPIWGDPSGGQWFTEFAQHNVNIRKAIKETGTYKSSWVVYGVEKINERLKPRPGHTVWLPGEEDKIEDAPKLLILDTEENRALVREWELLEWHKTREGKETDRLDETNDPEGHFDLSAAFRYLAVSYKKTVTSTDYNEWKNELPENDLFEDGFYT